MYVHVLSCFLFGGGVGKSQLVLAMVSVVESALSNIIIMVEEGDFEWSSNPIDFGSFVSQILISTFVSSILISSPTTPPLQFTGSIIFLNNFIFSS